MRPQDLRRRRAGGAVGFGRGRAVIPGGGPRNRADPLEGKQRSAGLGRRSVGLGRRAGLRGAAAVDTPGPAPSVRNPSLPAATRYEPKTTDAHQGVPHFNSSKGVKEFKALSYHQFSIAFPTKILVSDYVKPLIGSHLRGF